MNLAQILAYFQIMNVSERGSNFPHVHVHFTFILRSFYIHSWVALKYKRSNKMEKIVYNPGLQHLAEKVFLNLGGKDLEICVETNINAVQWNLKKEPLVDLLCYSSPTVQDDFRKRILEISNL